MLNIDSPFSDKQPLYRLIFLCQWMQTSWTDSQHWFHRASAITISVTKCIFLWKFTLKVVASTSLTGLLFLSRRKNSAFNDKIISTSENFTKTSHWCPCNYSFTAVVMIYWVYFESRPIGRGKKIFLFMRGEISNYSEISGQILPHPGLHLCLQRGFLGWLRFFFLFFYFSQRKAHISLYTPNTHTI